MIMRIFQIVLAFACVQQAASAQTAPTLLAPSEHLACNVNLNRVGQWVEGREPATQAEFDKLLLTVRSGLIETLKNDGCRTISNKQVVIIKPVLQTSAYIKVLDFRTRSQIELEVKLEDKDVVDKSLAAKISAAMKTASLSVNRI